MSDSLWLPTSDIQSLRRRAAIINKIRQFFESRDVLEVETPSLGRHSVSDPYLQALFTQNTPTRYLQTSPEYAMKRLLAAGSGDIYQICKAFREDEVGRHHNPEFTLLEWYRLGFSMQMLIEEVIALLQTVLLVETCEQARYSDLFKTYCSLDPVQSNIQEIEAVCSQNGLADYSESIKKTLLFNNLDELSLKANQTKISQSHIQSLIAEMYRDSLLNVLFNAMIEPYIGQTYPLVVTHFPKSQAALATVDKHADYANRFEVYYKSIELANGFNELTCATTQANRFVNDNIKRQILGLPNIDIDNDFLAALNKGLPECSGVALGVDRLVMLGLNKASINEVISFNYHNC